MYTMHVYILHVDILCMNGSKKKKKKKVLYLIVWQGSAKYLPIFNTHIHIMCAYLTAAAASLFSEIILSLRRPKPRFYNVLLSVQRKKILFFGVQPPPPQCPHNDTYNSFCRAMACKNLNVLLSAVRVM